MQNKTTAAIAGVILVAALMSLWFPQRSKIPAVNHNIHTSLGYVLAQEAAAAVHERGQVVAVIADFGASSSPFWREQWQAFTGELKKHTQISLVTRAVGADGKPVVLQVIVDQNAQAAGIVFFAGSPDFAEMQALASRTQGPKLILIGNPDVPARDYRGFFAAGSLAALVLPRSFADLGPNEHPKTPREWFDKYYQVYTPQNSDSLPL